MSISFTCSDVFYYLGIGRLDSKYNENPYYITIADFVENYKNIEEIKKDTVLMQGYQNDWADTTVVYGPIWTVICKFVAGAAGIILGADLLVSNASFVASEIGVSDGIIAITIVAIGTSLPELVTSVVAAMKGEEDIAIGNVVGSCIFNIGCVLGVSIAAFGSITTLTFSYIDLLMLILSAVLLFIAAAFCEIRVAFLAMALAF